MLPTIVTAPINAGGAAIASLTFARPALQDGDLLVAALRQQAGSTAGDPDFASAGFTRIGPAFVAPNTSRSFGFFVRPVPTASTEPASYVFTTAAATRAAGALFVVRGVDLTNIVHSFDASYGGTASGTGRATAAFSGVAEDALALIIGAAEFTAGISHVPTVPPAGWTEVAAVQSSLDSSTAGSRTGLWVGSMSGSTGNFPAAQISWSAIPSAPGAHAVALRGLNDVPPEMVGYPVTISVGGEMVTAGAFLSVGGELVVPSAVYLHRNYEGFTWMDLVADSPFYIAHRCGGANWPEFSQRGIENSITKGYKALEFSVVRCSTGEYVLSHDWTTTRMTGVNNQIPTTPWATLAPLTSTAEFTDNPAQSRTPLLRLNTALALATDRVIFIDHKATSSNETPNAGDLASEEALLDYLDTIPGATDRFVWKVFKSGWASADRARARGYKAWMIFYDAEISTEPTRVDSADFLGQEWNDSVEDWNSALAVGKPIIAHIITNEGQRDAALSKGAAGFMNSNVTLMGP